MRGAAIVGGRRSLYRPPSSTIFVAPWVALSQVGPAADPVQFNDSSAGGRLTISPGDNWQTRLTAAGAGGQVYVMPGSYNPGNGVVPCNVLNGQTIVLASSAAGVNQVFVDGQDIGYLFRGTTGVDDVTIRGGDITNFLPTNNQTAPVQPYQGNSELAAGNRWDVRFMEIHHTEHMCLRLGGVDMIARANKLHHASRLAVGGNAVHRAVFAYNEMSDNNYLQASPGWEAGGIKLVLSDDVHVHHNRSARNYGADIWFDIAMLRGTVEYNYGEDNQFESVFIEISFGEPGNPIRVRRNTSVGGGLPGWFPQAPFMVSSSSYVDVRENLVLDGVHGFVGMQQGRQEEPLTGGNRGLTPAGWHRLEHVTWADNEVHYAAGSGTRNASGIAFSPTVGGVPYDTGAPDIWSAERALVFSGNRYFGAGAQFAWQNAFRSAAQWRAYGHDPAPPAVFA